MIEIPPFSWEALRTVWIEDPHGSLLILLMGFFVTGACALVGVFLILRRMALIGDAVSHGVLPGIAIAYLIMGHRSSIGLFIGAGLAALLTVLLIEWVQRSARLKPDAAMGVVFTSMFAGGVLLISLFAGHVDLDADCVLYGEMLLTPLEPPVYLAGLYWGTVPVARMGFIFGGLCLLIVIFYRPLLVATFDPGLARTLGFRPAVIHYGVMTVLATVVVAAFESAGAILVIAMLILPGATALLLFQRLAAVLLAALVCAALATVVGYHLDIWLNTSTAAAIATVSFALFLAVWLTQLAAARLLRG
jgi:manganese/zinc/iron transport system permease protein